MCWRAANSLISGKRQERDRSKRVCTYRKEKPMTRKIVLAVAAGALALVATACNTVRGVGQDLESVANDVDQAT